MPNRCSPVQHHPPGLPQRGGGADYDVPPLRHVTLGASPGCARCASASPSSVSPVIRDGEAYDVPRPHNHHLNQLTPSSSASSLTADSISSSNRSSVANMPDYDVPKSHFRGPQLVLQPSQLYDVPPSHNPKELPLELNSALENLERLEGDTTGSIKKLLGFVGPGWRSKERLADTIYDIKLAVTRLQNSLNDLAEFGEGTLGNASKASDKNLAVKLAPLVTSLRKSYHTVNEAAGKLAQSNWCVERLVSNEDLEDRYAPDALDTLVSCSKALTDDIRQITSFIQGNGLLLFKKDTANDWTNEYDYVQLNNRGENRKDPNRYDLIENHDEDPLDNGMNLDSNDRQILTFFGGQYLTHHKNLMLAIDAFLNTVERNQPPKIFLAHSKFVVLSSHKLVHIGDTVYRNVACKEVKERALNFSNALSDVLAKSVMKTKQAALQFPTVTAVQEMVDSVLDISHAANNLKMCLLQATASFL
ncbi:breast cancer anti-estrogen resistance protein 1 isoform X2 [Coccinella septempunctata]|nr:breast cancer anti-estrogen resistance protein 1 isoform X2 [Coccinella septempunctata]XP_044747115.1 breast cancer anti-estrogen resistance protein 1 isoform X2 [Coccinella septempunctata]